MINVYYTELPKEPDKKNWDKHSSIVPDFLKARILKYRKWEDRHRSLAGLLLLYYALKNHDGFYEDILSHIKFDPYSKPYLENSIHFNIAHSEELVACATGENINLGIDIEKIRPISLVDYEDSMDPDQWQQITGSANPYAAFFKFWTIKEAVIKADGKGLYHPLSKIKLQDEEAWCDHQKWHFRAINLKEGYSSHIAADKEKVPVQVQKIGLDSVI